MAEIINLTYHLDQFEFYPGRFSAKEFGGIMLETQASQHWEVMERLRNSDNPGEKDFSAYVERLESCVDLQRFGPAAREAEGGYLTGAGYLLPETGTLPRKYTDPRDIPAEHRLTAAPEEPERKPSLLGCLAEAREACRAADAERSAAPEKVAPSEPEL